MKWACDHWPAFREIIRLSAEYDICSCGGSGLCCHIRLRAINQIANAPARFFTDAEFATLREQLDILP